MPLLAVLNEMIGHALVLEIFLDSGFLEFLCKEVWQEGSA